MARETPPAPDPLADLRPVEQVGLPEQPPAPEPQPTTVHDKAWHQSQIATVVASWHADRIVAGLIHAGGVCGCRYQAEVALVAVHGQPVETVLVEAEV